MGRQGPHTAARKHRGMRQPALGGLVLPLVSGHGKPMAQTGSGEDVWQQYRAAAHFASGVQQEHVLPPSAAAGTAMGLLRQYGDDGEEAGVAGDVAVPARES